MTAYITPKELKVGIDVGSLNHAVAISDDDGNILKEFEITHTSKGFASFFKIIEKVSHSYHATVSIAMEGYNGWARPLDGLIQERGYKLYNVNNVKLARFKEIFPGAAKTVPTRLLSNSLRAMACSLPPEPTTSTFTSPSVMSSY